MEDLLQSLIPKGSSAESTLLMDMDFVQIVLILFRLDKNSQILIEGKHHPVASPDNTSSFRSNHVCDPTSNGSVAAALMVPH